MNGALKLGLYEHGKLLDIALELHNNITGSSDCSSKEELINYRNAIQVAVLTWEPPVCHWARFDNAVRELCEAVLEESRNPSVQYLFNIKEPLAT